MATTKVFTFENIKHRLTSLYDIPEMYSELSDESETEGELEGTEGESELELEEVQHLPKFKMNTPFNSPCIVIRN